MKYNHHPDPAIGFCIEIDEIKAMAYNRRIGLDPEPTLENRIERAMGFRVGGDLNCIDAKATLRELEREIIRR
jgi:predicted pyridoxine 5'-phosphate oxidase superfamily flavin-nucleotide-binding protein